MICSTQAFVLRSFDFRETSKIVIFFSKEYGKVKGILKGIRKDPRKFSSTLSPLSLNHIIFYKKRASEIHLVSQCDSIDDFGLSKGDPQTFGFTCVAIELVDLLMPAEDPNPKVFELIFDFLKILKSSGQDTRSLFQIKMLALSGFKPHFDSCLACDTKIQQEAYFSMSRGGLLCPRCLYQDKKSELILPGTIASILYMERAIWQNCLRLALLPSVKKQLEEILSCFVHFHVGKPLKTERFVHELLDL